MQLRERASERATHFLTDERNARAQARRRLLANGAPVDGDRAALDVVPSKQEPVNRALAAPGRSNQRGARTGRDRERQLPQHVYLARGVRKAHCVELDGDGVGFVLRRGLRRGLRRAHVRFHVDLGVARGGDGRRRRGRHDRGLGLRALGLRGIGVRKGKGAAFDALQLAQRGDRLLAVREAARRLVAQLKKGHKAADGDDHSHGRGAGVAHHERADERRPGESEEDAELGDGHQKAHHHGVLLRLLERVDLREAMSKQNKQRLSKQKNIFEQQKNEERTCARP